MLLRLYVASNFMIKYYESSAELQEVAVWQFQNDQIFRYIHTGVGFQHDFDRSQQPKQGDTRHGTRRNEGDAIDPVKHEIKIRCSGTGKALGCVL